jgi:hypothetical protein
MSRAARFTPSDAQESLDYVVCLGYRQQMQYRQSPEKHTFAVP